MKKEFVHTAITYALVFTSSGFTVMGYEDWKECPIGCVMSISDNLEDLRAEADSRNDETYAGYYVIN